MAISKNAVHGQQSTNEESNMKPKALRILLLSSAIAGLAGMAGTISAQTFTATATVQNAVTINQVTPLSFGTVFATTTAAGSASADETYSSKLTLTDAGTASAATAQANVGPNLLSLGGATAGQFAAPGLPLNSSVSLVFKNAAAATHTNATVTLAECPFTLASDAAPTKIVMTHSSNDPSLGFFCVDAFTTNRTNLIGAGYTLPFGVTELTFNLGATLVAQAPLTGAARTFEAGVYTGSFEMEISFN